MKKNVIFIKIQKCSSTSVKKIIDDYAIKNQLKLLTMRRVLRRNGTWGPSPGGWHRTEDYNMDHLWSSADFDYNICTQHHAYDEIFFNRFIKNPTYITFIRNPLDRAISAFYSPDVRPFAHERKMQFQEWWTHHHKDLKKRPVRLSVHAALVDNFISYMLGFDLEKEITEDALKKRFSFIGLTENFDDSIKKMEKVLQWNFLNKPYPHIRKGPTKKASETKEQLSSLFVENFKERNQRDYKIYEISKRLFEQLGE